jgi:hypothetical protein
MSSLSEMNVAASTGLIRYNKSGTIDSEINFILPGSDSQINRFLRTYEPKEEQKEFSTVDHDLEESGFLAKSEQPFLFYELTSPVKIDKFNSLQKWEGCVTKVTKDSFFANLVDLTNSDIPEEEVEIPIKEIVQEDIELIRPGAVFYWNIGYYDKTSGRLRSSLIRFRRLPLWTKNEINLAKSKAEELSKSINAITTED